MRLILSFCAADDQEKAIAYLQRIFPRLDRDQILLDVHFEGI